ncbi:MAG: DUF1456 domain-containing protein [Gammaproteobacteria bacterium]|nr:MAG: DUF1456 domain-containing protein [Gammaproteobacteria bacterium]
MTNNDVLRRIRYVFNFDDNKMISIFSQADVEVTRQEISSWLKKDDDSDFKRQTDQQLAQFLNGLINDRRGKKEGPQVIAEKKINGNIIFRKLKIALDLKSDDILHILKLADFSLSNHELSAFFRKPGHKHYRKCKEQVLRCFLQGLQLKHRDQK